ncbi:transcription factor 20-like [Clinocottus analis]|uniref:transcription factor 20-like n=1 Tax=Clinocottus analis TaxID=304258 RepID=UPI0035BFECD7
MEVSPQDPALMAMDLSKGYSVNPLTRGHPEAMDLAKRPEWYHRRPPASCGADLGSPYRSRASSSFGAALHAEPGAPVCCRDAAPGPESLGHYMNSTLAPGLDLYRDGVHGGLWHPGFYGPADATGGPILESSGGEESDSGSDVIFLVSSAEEPLLCGSFLPDGVRRIVEPLSPAESSPEEARGCYLLPQPLSSPSPASSFSEDSSDSSADIPVRHARPVVLLSDLAVVYANPAASPPVDISSDDSDVVEVSIAAAEEKASPRKKKRSAPRKRSPAREPPPQSEEDERVHRREVRRSTRIRKSPSDTPPFTGGGGGEGGAPRHSLRRRAKSDAVGIYNESGDSDGVMDFAVRLCASDEESATPSPRQPSAEERVSSNSGESDADAQAEKTSPQKKSTERRPPRRRVSSPKSAKRKKPLGLRQTTGVRTKRRRSCGAAAERRAKTKSKKPAARRKRRGRAQTGPSALFAPREPEIKLKYANAAAKKKNKRPAAFCPFVHVKKTACTVVNYQEDEGAVRSSGGRRPGAAGPPSGFVPGTTCFRLARFASDGGERPAAPPPLCCLCGQTANAAGLGDLHGPYRPAAARGEEEERSLVSRRSVNSSEDGCGGEDDDGVSPPPVRLDEGWIHEDCGVWSAGVFLVRGRLYGLEEAARLAQETICSACRHTGAIMGCFQKACARNYHYRCAVQSGCVLNEDNFSVRCPEHKNKLLTVVNGQHKR